MELKELISKAKEKEVKAMEELFIRFTPLLKSRAKRYSRIGLEYEEVFQQAALIFILAVYDYMERPPYYLCRLYQEEDRLGIMCLLSKIPQTKDRNPFWSKTRPGKEMPLNTKKLKQILEKMGLEEGDQILTEREKQIIYSFSSQLRDRLTAFFQPL